MTPPRQKNISFTLNEYAVSIWRRASLSCYIVGLASRSVYKLHTQTTTRRDRHGFLCLVLRWRPAASLGCHMPYAPRILWLVSSLNIATVQVGRRMPSSRRNHAHCFHRTPPLTEDSTDCPDLTERPNLPLSFPTTPTRPFAWQSGLVETGGQIPEKPPVPQTRDGSASACVPTKRYANAGGRKSSWR